MKIVIEIPDSLIKKVKDHYVNPYDVDEICDAILKGTPLPEHHGRLIDVKQIVYEKECILETDGCCTTRSTPNIAATPTIIEGSENE